jgi:hypothetical protein
MLRGELSAEEQRDLDSLQPQTPEEKQEFEQLKRLHEVSIALRAATPEQPRSIAPKVLAEIRAHQSIWSRFVSSLLTPRMAAGVYITFALFVCIFLPLQLLENRSPTIHSVPTTPGGLIGGGFGGSGGLTTRYNDVRMSNSVNAILTYIEGTFGALVIVMSFFGALVSGIVALRTRKRFAWVISLAFLAICLGAFIFRSFLVSFNAPHNDSLVLKTNSSL